MSNTSFFEQEDFDESKLQDALRKSEGVNGKKKTFASDAALGLLGEEFKFEEEKKKLIENLDWFKSLSVEEFTFRKKWEEVQEFRSVLTESGRVKALIWSPTDLYDEKQTIKDIENIHPIVVLVKSKEHQKIWDTLRIYSHSADYNQAPGRLCRYLIYDEFSQKVLGFSSIASEVPAMSCRDEAIGWDKETRIHSGRLNNSAIATTIASTQPFGTNFLGGKFIAAMMTSSDVRDAWKNEYNSLLVGMTTTSLYGSYSMYNSLKWWRAMGSSKGQIPIKPTEEQYKKWNSWLKKNRPDEYRKNLTQKEGVSGPVTSPKMRILEMIFNSVGIKLSKYKHGYARGVYFSFFYDNTKEFLCNKIEEKDLKMSPLIVGGVDEIIKWWRPRAIQRYLKLKSENRLRPDKLFYSDMVGMKYEVAKQKYFHDVGR
jgi:hypothetical protein